jgi:hypothetical protein
VYSPDGKYLAVGSADGQPRLFNAADGQRLDRGGFAAPSFAIQTVRVAMSIDGQRLGWTDGGLCAWR